MSRPEIEPTPDIMEAMYLAGRQEVELVMNGLQNLIGGRTMIPAGDIVEYIGTTLMDRWNDLGVSDE